MESTPQQTSEGKAVVAVLAAVLERLVNSNSNNNNANTNTNTPDAAGQQVTKFHALKAPGISIKQYLERIHKYASCSTECFILALIYIDRLIQNTNFILSELNVHRVVITSILLAAKFFDDAYYNNAYYAKVGGVLVSEMNGLEVEFLFRINFSLHVKPDVFRKYQDELVSHAIGAGLEQPSSSISISIQPQVMQQSPIHIQQAQQQTRAVSADSMTAPPTFSNHHHQAPDTIVPSSTVPAPVPTQQQQHQRARNNATVYPMVNNNTMTVDMNTNNDNMKDEEFDSDHSRYVFATTAQTQHHHQEVQSQPHQMIPEEKSEWVTDSNSSSGSSNGHYQQEYQHVRRHITPSPPPREHPHSVPPPTAGFTSTTNQMHHHLHQVQSAVPGAINQGSISNNMLNAPSPTKTNLTIRQQQQVTYQQHHHHHHYQPIKHTNSGDIHLHHRHQPSSAATATATTSEVLFAACSHYGRHLTPGASSPVLLNAATRGLYQ